jgi:hypothetical protein
VSVSLLFMGLSKLEIGDSQQSSDYKIAVFDYTVSFLEIVRILRTPECNSQLSK